MAWASSDDRDDRKRGDGEIRRVAFLFCRFPPHHIDLLMLFCLRLHLLAFFLCCIASGVGWGTQKRGLGCGGELRQKGMFVALGVWRMDGGLAWLWLWLDEAVCLLGGGGQSMGGSAVVEA